MHQIVLVRHNMLPVPSNLKVIADYGLETIIPNSDSGDMQQNIKNGITGKQMHLEGEAQAFVDWLKPFDGVWICTCPLLSDWKVVHVKRSEVEKRTEAKT